MTGKAVFVIEGDDESAAGFRQASANASATAKAMADAFDRASAEMRSSMDGVASASKNAAQTATREFQSSGRAIKSTADELSTAYRTAVAFFTTGAIASGARAILEAQVQLQGVQATLEAVTGSQAEASREFAYASRVANELGRDVNVTTRSYAQFMAAARGTSLEGKQAAQIFQSVAKAATAMQLSTDDTRGVLLALSQMISKGTVQAEELRGQLGERLPGAFQLAARAMGVTTAELGKMLQSGQVAAEDLLPRLAQQLEQTYGAGAQRAATALGSELSRVGNEWERFKQALGNSEALTAVVRGLTDQIRELNRQMADPRGMGAASPYDAQITGMERLSRATFQFVGYLKEAAKYGLENSSFSKLFRWIWFGGGPEFPTNGPVGGSIDRRPGTLPDLPADLPGVTVTAKKYDAAKEAKAAQDAQYAIYKQAGRDYAFNEDLSKRTAEAMKRDVGGVLDEWQKTQDKISEYYLEVSAKAREASNSMSIYAEQAARNMQDAFANFLFDPFNGGVKGMLKNFLDVIRRMVAERAAAKIFEGFGTTSGGTGGFASFLSSFFGGKRAMGGPVQAGRAYLVNENTPRSEYFVPGVSGTIVPSESGTTGRGLVYAPVINIDARSDRQQIAQLLDEALRQNSRSMMAGLQRNNPGIRW